MVNNVTAESNRPRHEDYSALEEFFQYESALTLKSVFDSIRNSGIAAGIIVLGFWTMDHSSPAHAVFGSSEANKWSILLMAFGMLMLGLTLVQSALLVVVRIKKLPDRNPSGIAHAFEVITLVIAIGSPLITLVMTMVGLTRGVMVH